MKTADLLIKENNEKRKQLNDENLKYYEDMLVYLRLSFSKSELATEEILSELLDHLLDAQAVGKSAYDVFGDEPKGYVEEIIGALTKKASKNFIGLFLIGVLIFLGVKEIFGGIIDLIFFYGFSKGSFNETIYLGTIFLNIIVILPVAFVLIYLLIIYFRWSSFKKINVILEFFLSGLWGIISVGIFMLIIYLIPEIGPSILTPIWIPIVIGSVLLLLGWYVVKKN